MPKTKRSPINSAPTFGGGIFRAKSDVDEDLAQINVESEDAEQRDPEPLSPVRLDVDRDDRITNERTFDRSNEISTLSPSTNNSAESNERTNERWHERMRVRHSFDIFNDQLISLGDIQITRHRLVGRKPKLGDLVQEALDEYIQQHCRTNERTNVLDEIK